MRVFLPEEFFEVQASAARKNAPLAYQCEIDEKISRTI
jgi:hypothetical protein